MYKKECCGSINVSWTTGQDIFCVNLASYNNSEMNDYQFAKIKFT